MATELTTKTLNLNSFVDLLDGETPIDLTNEDEVKYEPVRDTRFFVYVQRSDGDNELQKLKVKAGDYFQNKRLGNDNDYELEVGLDADGDSALLGPFESAKFKNEDGEVIIEAETDGEASSYVVAVEVSYEES